MSKIIAITGPSLAGKSTLTNSLKREENFIVPRHITTREQRIDDEPGFYRYVSVEDFNRLKEKNEMLFSSGAGNRFYGLLREDVEDAFQKSENAVVNISYKDIYDYILLEYKKMLLTLTFRNLKKGMEERCATMRRKMTPEELTMRILAATSDHQNYFDLVEKNSDIIFYTDETTRQEVFKKAKQKIKRYK